VCLLVLVCIVQAAADLLQRLSDRSKEQSLNHRLRRLTERTCAVVREATVLRHDTGFISRDDIQTLSNFDFYYTGGFPLVCEGSY